MGCGISAGMWDVESEDSLQSMYLFLKFIRNL